MSIILRILLLVASLLTATWILWKIRRNKVKQEDSTYWICFAMILALLGMFPQVSYFMASTLGIMSPANFVYLVIIFLLLEKMLSLSIQISTLENKVDVMAAELAIRCKDLEDKGKEELRNKEELSNEEVNNKM